MAAHDLTPLLLQHEDQFAYEVASRALDRSADGNRLLDTLFFALMAAQTAIFAMLLGKVGGYAALECTLTLWAFGLALAGAGLSVFIGDGPDPNEFMAEFPRDPQATRSAHIDDYLVKVVRNGRLMTIKIMLLALAAALTIVPLAIATAGQAGLI